MTRKDFILIASIIRDMPTHSPSLRAQRDSCARAFAKGLKATNGQFKEELFYQAATGLCPLNARVTRDVPEPFDCLKCGQRIDDGKPCGCGAR